jgi:hypothetical protein
VPPTQIHWEGLDALVDDEVADACRQRGLVRGTGQASREALRHRLRQWLQLSLNREIPSSLLLLSSAIMMRGETLAEGSGLGADELKLRLVMDKRRHYEHRLRALERKMGQTDRDVIRYKKRIAEAAAAAAAGAAAAAATGAGGAGGARASAGGFGGAGRAVSAATEAAAAAQPTAGVAPTSPTELLRENETLALRAAFKRAIQATAAAAPPYTVHFTLPSATAAGSGSGSGSGAPAGAAVEGARVSVESAIEAMDGVLLHKGVGFCFERGTVRQYLVRAAWAAAEAEAEAAQEHGAECGMGAGAGVGGVGVQHPLPPCGREAAREAGGAGTSIDFAHFIQAYVDLRRRTEEVDSREKRKEALAKLEQMLDEP